MEKRNILELHVLAIQERVDILKTLSSIVEY